MKKKVNAVTVVEKGNDLQADSPANMIRMAVAGKADLVQLKELLAIQREFEANNARKVFASSFALAQENIASVIKTKTNQQTHSKYASLDNIIESAKPVYTREGFSVIFYEGDTTLPEHIRIFADVLHKAGHKETYHYDVPMDGKGIQGNANMTKIHAKASSTSYGRRYLMCMIWNIPTQDDDGNAAGKPVELIDKEQINFIIDNLIDLNCPLPGFLKYMKLEKLEDMPVSMYQKATAAIEAKRKEGKK